MDPLDLHVHRFEPRAPGGPDVTVFALHGTGGDENDLLPLARALVPGAAVLSPRGNVLEHGMPRFFRRLAEGVFDEADLVRRSGDLAAFVRAAAARYGFDLGRAVALGYSNGANVAASVMLLHPGLLRRAVLLRAMVPLVPEERPDLSGSSALVAAGRLDPMIPEAGARRLAALLAECGADVELHVEETGHGLGPGDLAAARAWIERAVR